MEGRGRSRARKKRRYASPKRLLSFLLTAAMVLTNMGPDLSLAYAATATDVTFEMEGADLVQCGSERWESGARSAHDLRTEIGLFPFPSGHGL